jgi:hypothetical protein
MTGPGKLRLALAVYEAGAGLDATLDRLSARGIGNERLGIIAPLDAVPSGTVSSTSHASAAPRLASLLAGATPFARWRGQALPTSPLLVERWRAGLRVPALWAPCKTYPAEPCLHPELAAWIDAGAFVLAIEPANPQDLWTATRVLLECSACPVQTIEYSLAHG